MGAEKKTKGPKTPVWSTALLWALGQWAVCWFVTETELRDTIYAVSGAFASGWVTASLSGRLARWGFGAGAMMVSGLILGLLVFSGAFSGLTAALSWWKAKDVGVNWEELQAFLTSRAAIPPAVLGLITGLYVRARIPSNKKK